jgi:uncharacterized protein YjiS (DUF1127 family)
MDANRDCPYFLAAAVRPQPSWLRRLSPVRLFGVAVLWCERAEQRRRLAQLDNRMLRDIGLSRSEAYRESSKWFWQD